MSEGKRSPWVPAAAASVPGLVRAAHGCVPTRSASSLRAGIPRCAAVGCCETGLPKMGPHGMVASVPGVRAPWSLWLDMLNPGWVVWHQVIRGTCWKIFKARKRELVSFCGFLFKYNLPRKQAKIRLCNKIHVLLVISC